MSNVALPCVLIGHWVLFDLWYVWLVDIVAEQSHLLFNLLLPLPLLLLELLLLLGIQHIEVEDIELEVVRIAVVRATILLLVGYEYAVPNV